jgi:hypothetical protein
MERIKDLSAKLFCATKHLLPISCKYAYTTLGIHKGTQRQIRPQQDHGLISLHLHVVGSHLSWGRKYWLILARVARLPPS